MEINTKIYEAYYRELEQYHEYLIPRIVSVRPWGGRGIQVTLDNGTRYNYDSSYHSIRKVVEQIVDTPNDVTDENTREAFAMNLQDMMRSKGFNQLDLASSSGLSTGVINKYVTRKSTPTLTAIRKIACALDCSITDLIE